MSDPSLVAIFKEFLAALRGSVPPEQQQMILFQYAMRIFSHDWTPFDTALPLLQPKIAELVQQRTAEEYAMLAANRLFNVLAENSDLNLALLCACKEELQEQADFFGSLVPLWTTSFTRIIAGTVQYDASTAAQPYSQLLKAEVQNLIGQWFASWSGMLVNGDTDLVQVLQVLQGMGMTAVAQHMPEQAGMATMAMPMLMGLLQQLYQAHKLQ